MSSTVMVNVAPFARTTGPASNRPRPDLGSLEVGEHADRLARGLSSFADLS